jgi:predicted Zn-dependent protease
MSDQRILPETDCRAILKRAHAFAHGGGDTAVEISSWWQGELRWGRNRVSLASDRRNIRITVSRMVPNGSGGSATTNQLDDVSLEAAVRAAERRSTLGARLGRGVGFYPTFPDYPPYQGAAIWSDATAGLTTELRGEIARAMIAPAEAAGLCAAGYLEVRLGATAWFGTDFPELRAGEYAFWEQPYVRWSQAQCSTTVRDAAGTGSGWAGASSYDWERIDPSSLAVRAVEKCRASRNPVALEPGRYTVILEPQAVADLMEILVSTLRLRETPEGGGRSPWTLGYDDALRAWRAKLGLKVVDERITITHDPANPELGIVMHPMQWPRPVTWIERGVLTNLGHRFQTDMEQLGSWYSLRGATGYRMSGGETPVEEMIRTTRRGLLITRLSSLRVLDPTSLLSTGFTRDGLWLIENGEITKAVKNFRFTESPLFVLNNIEQLGEPVPVFRPTRQESGQLTPAIVPPLKARDFSFTSLVDAV